MAMKDWKQEVPSDDLVQHTRNQCVCGPTVIPVVKGTGELSTITVHHRLGLPRRFVQDQATWDKKPE